MSPVNSDELVGMMDVPTLAVHLGVTERFVRRLVEYNRVPYYKIGRFVRFHPDDIANWLETKRIQHKHND